VHNRNTMALLWNPRAGRSGWQIEAQSGDLKEAPLRRDVRSLACCWRGAARAGRRRAVCDVEALRQGRFGGAMPKRTDWTKRLRGTR